MRRQSARRARGEERAEDNDSRARRHPGLLVPPSKSRSAATPRKSWGPSWCFP